MNIDRVLVLSAFFSLGAGAHASVYQFNYAFNDGVTRLSGVFNGAADGDVIHITDFQSLSYSRLGLATSYVSPMAVTDFNGTHLGGTTSFSGAVQDFYTGYVDVGADAWWIGAHQYEAGNRIFMGHWIWRTDSLVVEDLIANNSWRVSAVPEPSGATMLLTGLGAMVLLSRKRDAPFHRYQASDKVG